MGTSIAIPGGTAGAPTFYIDDYNATLLYQDTNTGFASMFKPDVVTYNDYYPFGMLVPNRHANTSDYRYGFNGKEKDDEVKGEGIQYDYGFRIYDARIGKFLSQDPLMKEYPFYTPYQFAGNSPIMAIDLDGLELKISTSVASIEQINSDKSKLTLAFDSHIHIKVLNATGVKMEGFEKIADLANDYAKNTFSDKTGTGLFLGMTNFKGKRTKSTGILYNYTATSKKVSTSYQMISSIEDIRPNDYVLILTDDKLKVTYEGTGIAPPAYTDLEGQSMIVISDRKFGAKLINGKYDFNGGGNVVSSIASTINHEIGHWLGLDDKYSGTGTPFKGFETNTMGNSFYKNINSSQGKETVIFLMRMLDKLNVDKTHHSSESAKTSTKEKLKTNRISTPK